MSQKHGMLEDVAAEIGFTAATTLVDWFGGFGQIYIPPEATEDHPIGRVIGMPAFRRLVKFFEGAEPTERFLWMNNGENREIARRDRLIAVLVAVGGLGSKQIAAIIGMSESSVRFSKQRVEQMGILPMILKRAGLDDGGANPLAKVPLKFSEQKPQQKAGVKSRGKVPAKSRGHAGVACAADESTLVKRPHKRKPARRR